MAVLETKLNARSADFAANAAAMRAAVDDLDAQLAKSAAGGGEVALARHVARGKLPPRKAGLPARPPPQQSGSALAARRAFLHGSF